MLNPVARILLGMHDDAPCSAEVDADDAGRVYLRWRRSDNDLASVWIDGEAVTVVIFIGQCRGSTKYDSAEDALPSLLRWANHGSSP